MHSTDPRPPEDPATQLWGLASDRVALAASTLTVRPAAPDLLLATYLHGVEPSDAAALEADLADAAARGCRRVVLESTTPPWVEAHLLLHGWTTEAELRLRLPAGSTLRGGPRDHVVRPASDVDADWRARAAMLRADHLEEDARHGVAPRPAAQTEATVAHRAALERHAPYVCAIRDGAPIGFLCTWVAPSGVGVIEDVFVHPDHRGEGVASTLLHHAVASLRERGADAVVIAAEVGDLPAVRYARMGFAPDHVVRSSVLPS